MRGDHGSSCRRFESHRCTLAGLVAQRRMPAARQRVGVHARDRGEPAEGAALGV